jgi:hypothetical protein
LAGPPLVVAPGVGSGGLRSSQFTVHRSPISAESATQVSSTVALMSAMPAPGDPYANAFIAEHMKCWRMIHDRQRQAAALHGDAELDRGGGSAPQATAGGECGRVLNILRDEQGCESSGSDGHSLLTTDEQLTRVAAVGRARQIGSANMVTTWRNGSTKSQPFMMNSKRFATTSRRGHRMDGSLFQPRPFRGLLPRGPASRGLTDGTFNMCTTGVVRMKAT